MGAAVIARSVPVWHVGVVIPAQNEESGVERCIRSVLASCDACDRCDGSWIVVVADGCTDGTAELARRSLGGRGTVVECSIGSPGAARRIGVSEVLRHFGGKDPGRVWLANTDADTHVPRDWIDTHLRHADSNAEAVAGIVQLDPDGLREDVKGLFARTYELAPNGTHAHVHGANLGVRADAYLDVGGWSDLAVAEDHCLWGRLMRRGWRLLSPVGSVVHTSGRLEGRARGGFADTLRRELRSDG
jgi:cellulose synthase/poly-beta-1,6-N-acetylglucosamine synthase-like glycosyltransferase